MGSTILKLMSASFWCGLIVHAGITMFIQDWLGLEQYIVFAREHWWDMHWLWGAAFFAGAFMFYFHLRRRTAFFLRVDASDKVETDHDECG